MTPFPPAAGRQMNVCSLDFPDAAFDVVIDKGTMDSVLCGEGSTANVAKMCQEVSRCAPLPLAPSLLPPASFV